MGTLKPGRHQVVQEHAKGYGASHGILLFLPDLVQAKAAFLPAEPPFHFNSVHHVLLLGLLRCPDLPLVCRRAAQPWAGHPYAPALAVLPVLLVAVDRVGEHPFRVHPCPPAVRLYGIHKVRRLIVCLIGIELHPGVPAGIDAEVHLRPELYWLRHLPPHDRADERHVQAHNPLVHAVHLVVVHVLLLAVEFLDGPHLRRLLRCQCEALPQERLDVPGVAGHTVQQDAHHVAYLLLALLPRLGKGQVLLACHAAVCARLLLPVFLADSVQHGL